MNLESKGPFIFEIPEKEPNSFFAKFMLFVLALIFLIIPLSKIDPNTFRTNEVWMVENCFHEFCNDNSSCILINY